MYVCVCVCVCVYVCMYVCMYVCFEDILEMDLLMNASQQIQRLSLPLHSKMIPHCAVDRQLVTVFAARRESFRCPYFRKLFMLPPQ